MVRRLGVETVFFEVWSIMIVWSTMISPKAH